MCCGSVALHRTIWFSSSAPGRKPFPFYGRDGEAEKAKSRYVGRTGTIELKEGFGRLDVAERGNLLLIPFCNCLEEEGEFRSCAPEVIRPDHMALSSSELLSTPASFWRRAHVGLCESVTGKGF